jgi:hypothetical protein
MLCCVISALDAQAAEEHEQYANSAAIMGESTLGVTIDNSIEDGLKEKTKDAQDIELLRWAVEKFLSEELIVFNEQRVAATVNDNEEHHIALEKKIERHARRIDKMLTEAFGTKSRLASVCRALFRLAKSKDPASALKKAREIINAVNVEILMRREVGFYLLLDESQFCDGQLIVMPCSIVDRQDITTDQGTSANLLFVNIIDTDKKVHEAFNRLAFRAKAIAGLNHYCINYDLVLDDAKAQSNVFMKIKQDQAKDKTIIRRFFNILPGQASQLIENRVWAEIVLADLYDNNLLEMSFEELYDRSLQNIMLNAALYAVGTRNQQQPIIDFVVNDYDATGLNDIRKEIIARLIPIAYGEDIFTLEIQRLLTWANIIDKPRTDAIASRYILDRMAEKINLDCSEIKFSDYKYEYIVYAILHKYKDRGRTVYIKEIVRKMLAEKIDISQILKNEAGLFHPDSEKYVPLDQPVQTLMPFVDEILKKYGRIPHDETKHETSTYLSA